MAATPGLQIIGKKGINAAATGSTQIGTTDNGTERFYPTMVVFHIATIGGTVTIPITASIGTNASSYTNILAATLQTALTSQNVMGVNGMVLGTPASIPPNTAIYVNITIALGGIAPTGTVDVDLIGYYR